MIKKLQALNQVTRINHDEYGKAINKKNINKNT